MANRNFANSRMYTGHVMPVLLDCNFTVTSSNGLGITSLTGPYIQNVFMHTSTTPAVGNSNPSSPGIAVTNPNPASGTIIIQLQDSFNRLYGVEYSAVSPLGTPLAITASGANETIGVAYVITTLGDATAADWLALGVPAGITPAVGVAFIALATGAGTGTTARVAPTAAAGSNIFSMEVVGNSNLSLSPNGLAAQGYGAQIILQSRNDNSTDVPRLATIADGTSISIQLLLSNSSVLINGE